MYEALHDVLERPMEKFCVRAEHTNSGEMPTLVKPIYCQSLSFQSLVLPAAVTDVMNVLERF